MTSCSFSHTRAHTHTDWLTQPVAAKRDNWYWFQSSGKPASSPSSASCLGGRRKRCSFYSGPLASLYCSCQLKQLCSNGGWILFFSLHFWKGGSVSAWVYGGSLAWCTLLNGYCPGLSIFKKCLFLCIFVFQCELQLWFAAYSFACAAVKLHMQAQKPKTDA